MNFLLNSKNEFNFEIEDFKFLFKNQNFIYFLNLNNLFKYFKEINFDTNEEEESIKNKKIIKKLFEIIGIKRNEFISFEILIFFLKNFKNEIEFINYLFNLYSIHYIQFSKK